MKVTLESTTKFVTLDGVPVRIWEGHTEAGVPVHAYITRIGLAKDADQETFRRELAECRAPSAEVEAIPLRLLL